jgi:ABC-type thiamine transport system substrate-binding protein
VTPKRRNKMLETIIIIAIIVVLILYGIFTTIGLLKGLKKVELYESLFEDIKIKVNDTYIEMKDIDSIGAFEADDEVGVVFTNMKELVDELNNYITENINE